MDIFKNISLDRFLFSLQYMWKGMLGIFIVILVIIVAVYVMNFFIDKSEKKKSLDGEE